MMRRKLCIRKKQKGGKNTLRDNMYQNYPLTRAFGDQLEIHTNPNMVPNKTVYGDIEYMSPSLDAVHYSQFKDLPEGIDMRHPSPGKHVLVESGREGTVDSQIRMLDSLHGLSEVDSKYASQVANMKKLFQTKDKKFHDKLWKRAQEEQGYEPQHYEEWLKGTVDGIIRLGLIEGDDAYLKKHKYHPEEKAEFLKIPYYKKQIQEIKDHIYNPYPEGYPLQEVIVTPKQKGGSLQRSIRESASEESTEEMVDRIMTQVREEERLRLQREEGNTWYNKGLDTFKKWFSLDNLKGITNPTVDLPIYSNKKNSKYKKQTGGILGGFPNAQYSNQIGSINHVNKGKHIDYQPLDSRRAGAPAKYLTNPAVFQTGGPIAQKGKIIMDNMFMSDADPYAVEEPEVVAIKPKKKVKNSKKETPFKEKFHKYIDLQKSYGKDPFSKEGIELARNLTELYRGKGQDAPRFICDAGGCSEIASNVGTAMGYTPKRNHAWMFGNTNSVHWQNPNYIEALKEKTEQRTDDPLPNSINKYSSQALVDFVNQQKQFAKVTGNPVEGYYIGLNRANTDSSRKYAKQKDYPGNRGYEHLSYMLDDKYLIHGTGADASHPAYYVLDEMADGIVLPGYGPYEPVEAMKPGLLARKVENAKTQLKQAGKNFSFGWSPYLFQEGGYVEQTPARIRNQRGGVNYTKAQPLNMVKEVGPSYNHDQYNYQMGSSPNALMGYWNKPKVDYTTIATNVPQYGVTETIPQGLGFEQELEYVENLAHKYAKEEAKARFHGDKTLSRDYRNKQMQIDEHIDGMFRNRKMCGGKVKKFGIGGNVALTQDDYEKGLNKGVNVFEFDTPGPKTMTSTPESGIMEQPVHVEGYTQGEKTDHQVMMPGEDVQVEGDTVVEKPDLSHLTIKDAFNEANTKKYPIFVWHGKDYTLSRHMKQRGGNIFSNAAVESPQNQLLRQKARPTYSKGQ